MFYRLGNFLFAVNIFVDLEGFSMFNQKMFKYIFLFLNFEVPDWQLASYSNLYIEQFVQFRLKLYINGKMDSTQINHPSGKQTSYYIFLYYLIFPPYLLTLSCSVSLLYFLCWSADLFTADIDFKDFLIFVLDFYEHYKFFIFITAIKNVLNEKICIIL